MPPFISLALAEKFSAAAAFLFAASMRRFV
jgi:hypothetical protein